MVDINELSPHRYRRQRVLNERFPRDARDIPDQRHPIPVRARVVWERDGEEWVDGDATRWTDRVVFVELDDPRHATFGVWVVLGDVRRREGPAPR
jgi:hypothetical protein